MGRLLFFTILLFQFSQRTSAGLIKIQDKAIYGNDDRRFIDASSNQTMKELSKSIALIVSQDFIEKKMFSSLIKAQLLSDTEGVNVCRDEKFANHHSVNSCTGFLIAPDLVASAGHCFLSADDCANKKIIFNVRVENEEEKGYGIANHSIYECSEIVKSHYSADDAQDVQDFAVIRLKKKVTARRPLKLRIKGEIEKLDQVFMIGHPLGLPLVSTANARVTDISDPHFFKATLDSFEGNSGSPVFNSKTFDVEGILVRGEDDFLEDSKGQCYRNQVYDEGTKDNPSLNGEGVSRISEILGL
ncbi:MAG: trypsin-like serine peptidase [Bacteriovorax sp.]